jgi:hypothetical protein
MTKKSAPMKESGICVACTHNLTANPATTQCSQSAAVRFVCGQIMEDLQRRDDPAPLNWTLARFRKQGFSRAEIMKAVNCLIDSEVIRFESATVGYESKRQTAAISLREVPHGN